MKIVYAICTAVIAIPIALVHWPSLVRAQVDSERLGKIPVQMQQYVDDGKISGAVMLLARHGEVVLLEAVGLRDLESRERMRTDTIFQIQSMTKPVTAVATMMLIEDGLLRLNDPVEKYLSEFRGQPLVPNSDGDLGRETRQLERPITIRDLLTHTSGMGHGHHAYLTAPDVETLREVVLFNAQQPLKFQPGTTHQYSNYGFESLGRVIEVVSGVTYDKYVQERILGPLGMKDSFFVASAEQCARVASIYRLEDGKLTELDGPPCRPFEYPSPAGGMFSTAEDMFSFYQMMLNRGRGNGVSIVSPVSVETMTIPHVAVPPGRQVSGYGFGWWVMREPVGSYGLPLQPYGSYGHAGYWGTIGWVNPDASIVGIFLIHHRSDELPKRAFAEVFINMATTAIAD